MPALAVEFVVATGRFVNALDENGIVAGDAHPNFVRHRLGRSGQPD
jgi:hypothetical protein